MKFSCENHIPEIKGQIIKKAWLCEDHGEQYTGLVVYDKIICGACFEDFVNSYPEAKCSIDNKVRGREHVFEFIRIIPAKCFPESDAKHSNLIDDLREQGKLEKVTYSDGTVEKE